jgi:hypothetical protein
MLKKGRDNMETMTKTHDKTICSLNAAIKDSNERIVRTKQAMEQADAVEQESAAQNGKQMSVKVQAEKDLHAATEAHSTSDTKSDKDIAELTKKETDLTSNLKKVENAISNLQAEADRRGSAQGKDKGTAGASMGTKKVLGVFFQIRDRLSDDLASTKSELDLAGELKATNQAEFDKKKAALETNIGSAAAARTTAAAARSAAETDLSTQTSSNEQAHSDLKHFTKEKNNAVEQFQDLSAKTAESNAAAQKVIDILDSDHMDEANTATQFFLQTGMMSDKPQPPMHELVGEFNRLIASIKKEQKMDDEKFQSLQEETKQNEDDKEAAKTSENLNKVITRPPCLQGMPRTTTSTR